MQRVIVEYPDNLALAVQTTPEELQGDLEAVRKASL